jgi:hypothetical protein
LIALLPVGIIIGAGFAVAQGFGVGYLIDASIAVMLTWPAMIAAITVSIYAARKHPAGLIISMLAGMAFKALFAIIGGLALYVGFSDFQTRGVSLWAWIAGSYLVHLVVGIFILVGLIRPVSVSER